MQHNMSRFKSLEKRYINKMKSFNVKVEEILRPVKIDECLHKINPEILRRLLYDEEDAVNIYNEIRRVSLQDRVDLANGCLHAATVKFIERICTLLSISLFSKNEEIRKIADEAIRNLSERMN